MQEISVYDIEGNTISNLVQFDKDVFIYIMDSRIQSNYQVQFFNNASESAYVVDSTYSDGVLCAKIPNDLLVLPYSITGYVNITAQDGIKCLYGFKIAIRKKPKPSDWVYVESNDYITFKEVIQECRDYANSAELSSISANEYKDTALLYSNNAKDSENKSKSYADVALESSNNAHISEQNAKASELAANVSETNAKQSETNSILNANNSKEYANNAKISENNAKQSEDNSKQSEDNAKLSEDNAKISENNSKESENNSKTSEINSKESEDNAKESETNSKTSEMNAKTSEDNAKQSEDNAKESENNSKTSETNAKESELASKLSEDNAKQSEDNAKESETNSKTSEINSKESETNSKTSETNAKESENNAKAYMETILNTELTSLENSKKAESYAVGTMGDYRDNDDTDNAKYYYEQAKMISQGLSGALLPMGTITYEQLHTQTKQAGYMFNISNDFVTDMTFKDGAGKSYPAGTNVYYTYDGYWDCLAGIQVIGIKGNKENEYRYGYVNITCENIGALDNEDTITEDEIKSLFNK